MFPIKKCVPDLVWSAAVVAVVGSCQKGGFEEERRAMRPVSKGMPVEMRLPPP